MFSLNSYLDSHGGVLFGLTGMGDALTSFLLIGMWAGLSLIWLLALLTIAFRSWFLFYVTFGYLILCSVLFRPWNGLFPSAEALLYFPEEVTNFRIAAYAWMSMIVFWMLSGVSNWVNWHRLIWPPLEEEEGSSDVPHSEHHSDADGYVYQHVGALGRCYLKIALRDDLSEDVEVTRISQRLTREFAPLPREAVRLAVQNGVAAANKQFQTTYHVARIWYREADTPFLAWYQHAAEKIIERLSCEANPIPRSASETNQPQEANPHAS